jgi:hypothetical protein
MVCSSLTCNIQWELVMNLYASKSALVFLAVTTLLLSSNTFAQEERSTAKPVNIGQVIGAVGNIAIERNGEKLSATNGTLIRVGDVLTTSNGAVMEVRMVSGEEMTLRPNTRFAVDQFKAPKSTDNPGSGRSFYSLLKGAFRAVTHSLGKRDLDSYRINTPVATIGIRGSIIMGALDANGLGFGVEEGAGYLVNGVGSLEVPAGGFATVAGAGAAPIAVSAMPAALSSAGFETAGAVTGGAAGTASAAALSAGTVTAIGFGVGAAVVAGVIIGATNSDEGGAAAATSTSAAASSGQSSNAQ